MYLLPSFGNNCRFGQPNCTRNAKKLCPKNGGSSTIVVVIQTRQPWSVLNRCHLYLHILYMMLLISTIIVTRSRAAPLLSWIEVQKTRVQGETCAITVYNLCVRAYARPIRKREECFCVRARMQSNPLYLAETTVTIKVEEKMDFVRFSPAGCATLHLLLPHLEVRAQLNLNHWILDTYIIPSAVRPERRCASSGSVPTPFSLYPTPLPDRCPLHSRSTPWLRCSSGRSDLARARFPRRQTTAAARPWPRTWLTETVKMAGGMLDDGTRHNKSGAHGRRGAISV